MSTSRQIFEINTDTGSQKVTGPSFTGAIMQMRWSPTTADTGADLLVSLLPRAADSGDGFLFYNDNDCLGSGFTRVPLQPAHSSDGFDTGVDQYHPIVAAGDRLQVEVIPGGAAVVGSLFIWVNEN